jgi:hypothetical protein
MRSPARAIFWLMLLLLSAAPSARANPTEEDVLRSMQENVREQPNYGPVLAVMAATAGIIVAIVVFRQYQKRADSPQILNHPGKLLREMARDLEINPAQVRELKIRADELGCDHALTLLLCPSLTKGADESGETTQNARE